MIIKMKKTTLLCLSSEREKALAQLRDLGVMHIEIHELKESDDRKKLELRNADAERANILLSSVKPSGKGEKEASGAELCRKVLTLADERNELEKRMETLRRYHEQLLPWGDFSQELLSELQEEGMFIYLCSTLSAEYQELENKISAGEYGSPESVSLKVVKEEGKRLWFAVISQNKIDEQLLPIDNIPHDISLKEVDESLKKEELRLAEINEELAALADSSAALASYAEELREELEYVVNRDAMAENGAVSYIEGYIPVPELDNLRTAAEKNGWGLLLRDPGPDDKPPTLLKTPKILEMSRPIFDFIGISPGYREWDISGCFLFFFTIFFGIIVGDAGYGLIFLGLAFLTKLKFGRYEKAKLPIRLFFLLSCSTIVWGLMNGTLFAIPPEHLPVWMRGFKWFTDPLLKDKHIQQLCFMIAVVHLSFAHIWKAVLYINSRKALGEIGWALLLWGNYFTAVSLIVYPERGWPMTLLACLYIPGALLVVIGAIDWKSVSGPFDFFFGIIGTFVDLLSYIRLFAVGLSTYYIAKSFNEMGMGFFDGVDSGLKIAILVIPATILIFGGHLLNIVLALLAVLVHGIRLNTLEFSNHMALQWLGIVYKPFRKKD